MVNMAEFDGGTQRRQRGRAAVDGETVAFSAVELAAGAGVAREAHFSDSHFDSILDQLAQGQTFAESGTIAMFMQDMRDVPDAGSNYVPNASGSLPGFESRTERFRRNRYRGAVYIPQMEAADKMVVLTVLGLLGCFGILAAVTAYSMVRLTENIRATYTRSGIELQEAPVPTHVLLHDALFAARLAAYPEQTVVLYVKRAQAQRAQKMWAGAVRSFEEASLQSAHPMAIQVHLEYVDSLVHAGRAQDAMRYVQTLERGRMSEQEQQDATTLVGRLHFALAR